MYKITLTYRRSCVELGQTLELSGNSITHIIDNPEGAVDVHFDQEPTADQKAALQSALNMKITAEGAE